MLETCSCFAVLFYKSLLFFLFDQILYILEGFLIFACTWKFMDQWNSGALELLDILILDFNSDIIRCLKILILTLLDSWSF